MAYTAEQRTVIRRIRRIGAEVGASPKEIKAAFETGLVESGLRNLPGGDADSQGWRQERASLYPDPRNLDASIRRFFRETRAVKARYGRAGDLAAAVQRPAAQYRGRYQQRSSEADALLRGTTGARTGATTPRASSSSSTTTTVTTPGVDNSAARAQLVSQLLSSKGKPDVLGFALGIKGAQDIPGSTRTKTTRVKRAAGGPAAPAKAGSGGTAGFAEAHSPLFELFWQGPGGVNVKLGKRVPQGFVSGHRDHVHVAAGPKTVVQIGKLAQDMGLHVGENPHFGGVNPVHVDNSYHYRQRAIDVSGDVATMRAFAHRVARLYDLG